MTAVVDSTLRSVAFRGVMAVQQDSESARAREGERADGEGERARARACGEREGDSEPTGARML